MTTPVTFGDLAGEALAHLRQPVPSPGQVEDTAAALRAVAIALTRHVAEARATLTSHASTNRARHAPWAQAATQVSEALASATACLAAVPADPSHTAQLGQQDAAGSLRTAATSITLARDLLATHLASRPDGTRTARTGSEWAPLVTSPQLAKALLYDLAGWARHAAAAASQTAVTGTTRSAAARRDLATASHRLWDLDDAVRTAHHREPVTLAEHQLLHAISARHIPEPR